MGTTIRVSDGTRRRIAELASSTGRPMTEVVEEAVEALERRVVLDHFNARYAELRADPEAWSEIIAERSVEEGVVRDTSD